MVIDKMEKFVKRFGDAELDSILGLAMMEALVALIDEARQQAIREHDEMLRQKFD